MPTYVFTIELAEDKPLTAHVDYRSDDAAKRRGSDLLAKNPHFRRISVERRGRILCQLSRPSPTIEP
ncbi:MAG: hypothetical protein ACHP84_19650 [Caulobacterales bacterium]